MNLALDAMGGDHAPAEVVLGALEAASLTKSNILLVGDPQRISAHLPSPCPRNIQIVPASQVIEMEDTPLEAIRRKRDSSLVVAVDLVKKGQADAMISAGNTGAAVAATLLSWRPIEGVQRPAIGAIIPNRLGGFLLIDAGASPDVDPEHLVQFGKLGMAYCQNVWKRNDPKVHLLNIGEEPGKGNSFSKRAFEKLATNGWFSGNIEGKDLFRKRCDVVVCDAFIGNVVLKTCEGLAEYIMGTIREGMPTSTLARIPYLAIRKLLSPLKKETDYAEYGGMPLLGLNGLCIICHGRSNAKAIKNAILQAEIAVQSNLVESMRAAFKP